MRHFLNTLDYPNKNHELIGVPDPLIVGSASSFYQKDEHPVDSELHLSVV